jgi:hypothetical protein
MVRRNSSKNRIGIIQSGTNNSTGNSLRSFQVKIRANVAKSTNMIVGRRADVRNVFIEIELAVKSDAK